MTTHLTPRVHRSATSTLVLAGLTILALLWLVALLAGHAPVDPTVALPVELG